MWGSWVFYFRLSSSLSILFVRALRCRESRWNSTLTERTSMMCLSKWNGFLEEYCLNMWDFSNDEKSKEYSCVVIWVNSTSNLDVSTLSLCRKGSPLLSSSFEKKKEKWENRRSFTLKKSGTRISICQSDIYFLVLCSACFLVSSCSDLFRCPPQRKHRRATAIRRCSA